MVWYQNNHIGMKKIKTFTFRLQPAQSKNNNNTNKKNLIKDLF